MGNCTNRHRRTSSDPTTSKRIKDINKYLENFVEEENNTIFNDDQAIFPKKKKKNVDANIFMQIKPQRSMINMKASVRLPVMMSLKTNGGTRTNVDLICVIDNSSSMRGQKLKLVRGTLKFLTETLTPQDRLSIILFNNETTRICGLKCVTPQNCIFFSNQITKIRASGGTKIVAGIEMALKTIKQRKYVNQFTSIFLLSDGRDVEAGAELKKIIQQPQNKLLNTFSINTFGFGTDYDEELLTKISKTRNGTFYCIKELNTLDEAFCNALGEIISVMAKDITIKLKNVASNSVEKIRIQKTYGDFWEKITDRYYQIKISQVMSEIQKDFVFELDIPAMNIEIGKVILEGSFQATGINGKKITGQSILRLTFVNYKEEIPQIKDNSEVIQNYFRVKASDAIEKSIKKADEHKYLEAQSYIDEILSTIEQSKNFEEKNKEILINDLKQVRWKCSNKKYWLQEGRKWSKSVKESHQTQSSFIYSNIIQSELLQKRKAKKKKRKRALQILI